MEKPVTVHLLVAQIVFLFLGGHDVRFLSQAQSVSTIEDVYVNVEGANAEFRWNADITGSGRTIAAVAWRKDTTTTVAQLIGSVFLPNAGYVGRVFQIAGVNAGLNLTGVQASDFGTYQCTVTLDDGTTLTDDADLGLARLPFLVLVIVHHELSGTIENGTKVEKGVSITLTCNSTGGKPSPTYTLKCPDGSTVHSDTLVISSFQEHHVGNYTCTASNVAGNMASDEFLLYLAAAVAAAVVLAWWAILLIVLAILLVIGSTVGCIFYCQLRGQKPTIESVRWLSSNRVEVKWTGESEGTYTVLYRRLGSRDWTSGPEVSTDDPPNYKYTLAFPKYGRYEVCVQGTITCCLCCLCCQGRWCLCCLCCQQVTSKIKEVTVPVGDNSPDRYSDPDDDHGSSGEQNTPFSPLHGNDTPKNDVPLVVMISEGQSHKVKLDPIVINKQNPAEKREKKKQKRKKVNKINASDEEKKPED